jgi:hypothetical protein
MDKFISAIVCIVVFTIGIVLGALAQKTDNTYKKYKMNLKCVQGELYEEVRTNMFVKSHLECFEQRTLAP